MSNMNCFLKCQIKGYILNISRITFSIYENYNFLSLQTRIAFSISKSLNQDQPLASIFEGSLVLLEIMLSRTQASCFAVLFCNQLFRRRLTRKINARWVLEPNFFLEKSELPTSDKMISHALTFVGISLRTVCPSTLLRAGSWRKR